MAEDQEATVGYMGEFWLHDGSSLYELVEVKEFDIPDGGAREQVEKTHLKSPGWRREYLSTFFEDVDFEVTLNCRVMSTTDLLLATARDEGDERQFKVVIPQDGAPASQRTGTCRCTNYQRGRVTNGDVIEATATFRLVSVDAFEATS